jgi:NADH-quinone oxidoreductase subunit A
MMSTAIVAYLTLFSTVGILFLIVALLLGRLFRPVAPSAQKSEAYECGEPPVGPGFVQFDLRFYVVALLFIVFEVEIALFFPPAVLFGKLNQIVGGTLAEGSPPGQSAQTPVGNAKQLAQSDYPGLGMPRPSRPTSPAEFESQARQLSAAAMIDMGLFFAVLLVGFAYLWRRGDLDWVRAVGAFGGQGSVLSALAEDYPPNLQAELSAGKHAGLPQSRIPKPNP